MTEAPKQKQDQEDEKQRQQQAEQPRRRQQRRRQRRSSSSSVYMAMMEDILSKKGRLTCHIYNLQTSELTERVDIICSVVAFFKPLDCYLNPWNGVLPTEHQCLYFNI